jgi:hypothetical protein
MVEGGEQHLIKTSDDKDADRHLFSKQALPLTGQRNRYYSPFRCAVDQNESDAHPNIDEQRER